MGRDNEAAEALKALTSRYGPDGGPIVSPDGERVVFASGRINAPRPWPRFWTIPPEGGMPEPMPLHRVAEGKLSPDGRRLAYQKVQPFESEWRNYRGGQAQPIRIVNLESLEVRKLPWEGSNDLSPVWVGDSVFFLSDRDGMMNVWEFDTRSETLRQRTRFTLFDCKKLESGPGTLIFENGGYLYTLPAASGEAKKLVITLRGDFPWARPHFEDVTPLIRVGRLSPTGKRAVFEARGEIFTVPAEKGDIRNLSRSSGSAERASRASTTAAHVYPDRSSVWASSGGGGAGWTSSWPLTGHLLSGPGGGCRRGRSPWLTPWGGTGGARRG